MEIKLSGPPARTKSDYLTLSHREDNSTHTLAVGIHRGVYLYIYIEYTYTHLYKQLYCHIIVIPGRLQVRRVRRRKTLG